MAHQKTVWLADDGREFTTESAADHHDAMLDILDDLPDLKALGNISQFRRDVAGWIVDNFDRKAPTANGLPGYGLGAYEAFRVTYQSSEQAAREAFAHSVKLSSRLATAERDLQHAREVCTNRANAIDRMQAWINQATDLLQAYGSDLRGKCYGGNGPAVEDVNRLEVLCELLADAHPNPDLREG